MKKQYEFLGILCIVLLFFSSCQNRSLEEEKTSTLQREVSTSLNGIFEVTQNGKIVSFGLQ